MKQYFLVSALIVATISAATAAPLRRHEPARSVESPRRTKRPPIANMPEAAQAPSSEDVGDGDSFGRSVNFLGYAQTYGVSIQPDCTGWEPGTCVNADEFQSAAIEKYDDAAVVRLPARAARSLLCISATPFGFASFNNDSNVRQNARVIMLGRWRIESDVLKDPALINSETGEPFNGAIMGGPFLGDEAFTLEPGANRTVGFTHTRLCNAGSLQRSQLIRLGLTEAQAREVFRSPITIRFGSYLRASWGIASMSPGYRIFGD